MPRRRRDDDDTEISQAEVAGPQPAGAIEPTKLPDPDEQDELYLAKASPVGAPIDPASARNPDPEDPLAGIIRSGETTAYEGNLYLPAQRALPEGTAPDFAPHVNVNRPYGSEPLMQEEGTGRVIGRTKPLSEELFDQGTASAVQRQATQPRVT